MNKKGFTLTELLVVVVILGIIAGLSIPLIRNLSTTFEKKKYENYADSVLSSAKLYTDAYYEDLFGRKEYGCSCITYDKLVEKNLLKDIEIEDMSCNSNKTYVMVIKQKDKYGYSTYLGCGKKASGKVETITKTFPANVEDQEDACSDVCGSGLRDSNISISIDKTQLNDIADKNKKKTRIIITSGTGINSKIEMYAKWSTTNNDFTDTGLEKVSFKVKDNQEASLLAGNLITTKSQELITPNANNEYFLIVRVDHLQDLYGINWKNPENPNSKYLSFGPFMLDNEKPTITAKAYKCDADSKKTGSALLTKTVTGSESESNKVFDLSSIANNFDGWLNKANYPYGICVDFETSDNYSIKKYKWEWNKDGQLEGASGYKTLKPNSIEQDTYNVGTTSKTILKKLSADGHRYARYTASDFAGNKTEIYIDVKLDKTTPQLAMTARQFTDSSNNNVSGVLDSKTSSENTDASYKTWIKYGMKYQFDITDNMGIKYRSWKWNDGGITTPNNYQNLNHSDNNSTGNFSTVDLQRTSYLTLTEEGYRYARFTIRDVAGNETYMNLSTKIDRTPPTITNINNPYLGQWRKDGYGLGIEASDVYSGVDEFYYTFKSGATQYSNNTTDEDTKWVKLNEGKGKTSFTTRAIGSKTINNKPVYIRVCDFAENCSGSSTNLKIDKTKPQTPTIKNDDGNKWTNGLEMTISSQDEHSGIGNYQYTYSANAPDNDVVDGGTGDDAENKWRIEDGAKTSATSYDSSFSREGDRDVYWRVCDAVGNCSDKATTHVKIDATAPTCWTNKTSTGSTSGVSVSKHCSDSGGSECTSSTSYSSGLKESQYVSVKDNAGNTGYCWVSVSDYKCNKVYRKDILGGWDLWNAWCSNHYEELSTACPLHWVGGVYDPDTGYMKIADGELGTCFTNCNNGKVYLPSEFLPARLVDVLVDYDWCYE